MRFAIVSGLERSKASSPTKYNGTHSLRRSQTWRRKPFIDMGSRFHLPRSAHEVIADSARCHYSGLILQALCLARQPLFKGGSVLGTLSFLHSLNPLLVPDHRKIQCRDVAVGAVNDTPSPCVKTPSGNFSQMSKLNNERSLGTVCRAITPHR